jgi:putative membrane protein
MLHTTLKPARAALAIAAVVMSACAGGDDRAGTDTTAATSASGGDVSPGGANASMSPAQQLGFVSAVDRAEVEEGEVARTKATNAQVRQFAQRMVTEHSSHMRQTGELAQQVNAGTDQPAPDDLRQMHEQTMQRLNSIPKGAAFDSAYINAQVLAHQTALQRLQAQLGASGTATGATGTSDTSAAGAGQVQQYLQATARTVQQHLEAAQQIQQRLSGTSGQ